MVVDSIAVEAFHVNSGVFGSCGATSPFTTANIRLCTYYYTPQVPFFT